MAPSLSPATKIGEWIVFVGTATAYIVYIKHRRRNNDHPMKNSRRNNDSSSSSPPAEPPSAADLIRALQDRTSLDAKERICSVDDNNNPLAVEHFRSEMRLYKLWHRATYAVILHKPPHDHAKGEQEQYVLVQRRSKNKDYGPGKLDPCPGGVVAYGESYLQNITRELQEEMGIHVVVAGAAGNNQSSSIHTLTRLFTFPYQDETIRVWGDLYEVEYCGNILDLVLQTDEVESIERMSLTTLKQQIIADDQLQGEDNSLFLPDSRHAMQLYFQRKQDERVQRKVLHGYSSSNLEEYKLRPKPQVVFFDCDDTLYFDGWVVANMLTKNINDWCVRHGLKEGQAYQLYKQYGTALRGLLAEGYMENSEAAIDGFLRDVHDIPVHEHIQKDYKLRTILLKMDPSIQKYIFTASVRHHAERCLQALGIDDLFNDRIIDCKDCGLHTKHDRRSFEVAMKMSGVTDPESCLFLDDSLKNLHTAREMGWRSVLVGRRGRDCGSILSSEHAEQEIDTIHDFEKVLPELFV